MGVYLIRTKFNGIATAVNARSVNSDGVFAFLLGFVVVVFCSHVWQSFAFGASHHNTIHNILGFDF